MKRRDFITLLGGTAAWPIAVRAQQPKVPVIGFLHQNVRADHEASGTLPAFRKGLAEAGYAEGRNVAIEYRLADSATERLPALAADLVRRGVAVIATPGSGLALRAAMGATATIPIVMGGGADPVAAGFVASLNRPGGNVTGYVEVNGEIVSKRLDLLHELMPRASRFAVLVHPDSPTAMPLVSDLQATASRIGLQVEPLVAAGTDKALDAAFATLADKKIEAFMVSPSPVYYGRRERFAALATQYRIPAIYWDQVFPEVGGLMSYGSSVTEMFRQAGIYAGRILKGEKPADMPVMQASKFELVINLKAAKAIGLTIPELFLLRADEVIE